MIFSNKPNLFKSYSDICETEPVLLFMYPPYVQLGMCISDGKASLLILNSVVL